METIVKFVADDPRPDKIFKDCYPSYDTETRELYICSLEDAVIEVFSEPELIVEVIMRIK